MLNASDNALLTQTGAGTPMGELFRRFWHPVLLSEELTQRDGPPVRLRVLGEDLVAFRDTQGRVGMVDARCPQAGIEPAAALKPEVYNVRAVDQVSPEADFLRCMDLYADAALGKVSTV